MNDASWRFRTLQGEATVGDDAIEIRQSPGRFLAGQRARWRAGDRWERAAVAVAVGAAVFTLAGLGYQLERAAAPGFQFALLLYVASVVAGLYGLWNRYLRRVRIPRSALTRVTVDADDRELTLAHEPTGRVLPGLDGGTTETTLELPTDEDLREAREVLRLRSVPVETPAPERETTFRVETRDGACFCERCHRQVSPSDAVCPACEYELRVEVDAA